MDLHWNLFGWRSRSMCFMIYFIHCVIDPLIILSNIFISLENLKTVLLFFSFSNQRWIHQSGNPIVPATFKKSAAWCDWRASTEKGKVYSCNISILHKFAENFIKLLLLLVLEINGNEWCFRLRFCIVRLYWVVDNPG